jgi:hypothetical protein
MDSCGSPKGDSSDQAFVLHHVGFCDFIELLVAFPRSPFSSLFEDWKGDAASK